MARSAGISGTGIALATGGALLIYAGIRNAKLVDALRAAAAGQPVAEGPSGGIGVQFGADPGTSAPPASSGTVTTAAGGLGAQIAAGVRKYIGVPYVFGGANPSVGFDCSGLATWLLHHDLGLNLPSNTHTVAAQFLVWGGATTIPRAQCAAGDLVCWVGHIGIAIDKDNMIAAPHAGATVRESRIWSTPAPTIRRVKPQTTGGRVITV